MSSSNLRLFIFSDEPLVQGARFFNAVFAHNLKEAQEIALDAQESKLRKDLTEQMKKDGVYYGATSLLSALMQYYPYIKEIPVSKGPIAISSNGVTQDS